MTDPDDIRTMFDSKYLGSWDFPADTTVTIARVEGGVVEGEKGRKDKKPIIHFKGWEKPLVMNKTLQKALYAMYGTYSAKQLIGKRVTLYATTCRGAEGGTVACVRARPKVPETPGVPQPQPGAGGAQ